MNKRCQNHVPCHQILLTTCSNTIQRSSVVENSPKQINKLNWNEMKSKWNIDHLHNWNHEQQLVLCQDQTVYWSKQMIERNINFSLPSNNALYSSSREWTQRKEKHEKEDVRPTQVTLQCLWQHLPVCIHYPKIRNAFRILYYHVPKKIVQVIFHCVIVYVWRLNLLKTVMINNFDTLGRITAIASSWTR